MESLLITFLTVGLAAQRRALTSRGKRTEGKGASGLRRDALYAYLRPLLAGMSAQQTQAVAPTTDKTYAMIAKTKGVKPTSVELPEGAQGHWIGDPNAQYVMLYSHGA